ncbi:MAG TPA: tRNA (adenosine(37)-N6)-threonylcarbamoyltransferase complex dimerization subunit type 1 TsaB [Solirubrobacteraceae bacterium]|jgi:tRNA threonylcarbamoyladenosine biosynthesis protein TsaB|nr:tRNA (adenosine(37)-N6)-threonylcarbamoyltransferase complex dimerization subunit type 1 TsaB [Solirubrobacteraceae bacterium]
MILLGFDTATNATSVALRLGDGSVTEARDDPAAGAHPGHATRLLAMADGLLKNAGAGTGDVDRIAVGVGPGTFTGLRVGVATARGLAQSSGAELVAVSSLRALAGPALEDRGEGAVLAVIDARRSEVFAAAYATGGGELAAGRALGPGAIASLIEEAGIASARALGDGAVRYRTELEAAGLDVAPDDSPLHLLRAAAICARAASSEIPVSSEPVLPDYLRRPDAELALEGAGVNGGRR